MLKTNDEKKSTKIINIRLISPGISISHLSLQGYGRDYIILKIYYLGFMKLTYLPDMRLGAILISVAIHMEDMNSILPKESFTISYSFSHKAKVQIHCSRMLAETKCFISPTPARI